MCYSEPSVMTGRAFFHYQFGERLGASGRGEAYEARDAKLRYGNAIPSIASRIDTEDLT